MEDFLAATLPVPAQPAPTASPPEETPPTPPPRVSPFTLFLILILLLGATEQLTIKPDRGETHPGA
ncbi:MAG TPA: hypothetical protein GX511_08550 [Firmicutes bacterium]|nr:hypothetical protein [Bacillota bacterium]